jgi:hypothetical protein
MIVGTAISPQLATPVKDIDKEFTKNTSGFLVEIKVGIYLI